MTFAGPVTFAGLSAQAKEVMGQLFIAGPAWDGFILSKVGRDELVRLKFVARLNGWQQLTLDGLDMCIHPATLEVVKEWHDKRWYKKAIA